MKMREFIKIIPAIAKETELETDMEKPYSTYITNRIQIGLSAITKVEESIFKYKRN